MRHPLRGWSTLPWRYGRRAVRLPVVIADGDRGRLVWLVVSRERRRLWRRDLPSLLGPASVADDDGMRASFQVALAWARGEGRLRRGAVTHWTMVDEAGVEVGAGGRSASGSMGLALAYLYGLRKDARRPFDSRYVLTAMLTETGDLQRVEALREKVPAVRDAGEEYRLAVAPGNLQEAQATQRGGRPRIVEVTDVRAALSAFRAERSRAPYLVLSAVIACTLAILGGVAVVRAQSRSRDQRIQRLVEQADRIRATDPAGSAAAALQAEALDHQGKSARDALIRLNTVDARLRGGIPGETADAVAVSPDGSLTATGGPAHTVTLRDQRAIRWRKKVGGATVGSLAFTSDGRTLWSSGRDGAVVRWDLTQRDPEPVQIGHAGQTAAKLALSPDGRMLGVLEIGRGVWIWRTDRREPPVLLSLDRPVDLVFAANDTIAVSVATRGTRQIAIYQVPSMRRERLLLPAERGGLLQSTAGLAAGRLGDGRRILVSGLDRRLTVWDVATWRPTRSVIVPSAIRSVGLGSESSLAVVGYADSAQGADAPGTAQLWDLNTGEHVGSGLGAPTMTFRGLSSPDASGRSFAAITDSRHVTLWSTRGPPAPFQGPVTSVRADPRSPDQVIVAGYNGRIQTIDLSTGAITRTIDTHLTVPTMSFAVSPDGGTLVTGHPSGVVRFWDRDTGRQVRTLTAVRPGTDPKSPILSLTFDAGGRRLATGSLEGTVRLWDLSRGVVLRDFPPITVLAARTVYFDHRREQLIIGYDGDAAGLFPLAGGEGRKVVIRSGVSSVRPLSADTFLISTNEGRLYITDPSLRPTGPQPTARHSSNIGDVAVAPKRGLWLTAGFDSTAKIIDGRDGREIAQTVAPNAAMDMGSENAYGLFTTAAFSGNERFAAFGTSSGNVVSFDLDPTVLRHRACGLLLDPVRRHALEGCR